MNHANQNPSRTFPLHTTEPRPLRPKRQGTSDRGPRWKSWLAGLTTAGLLLAVAPVHAQTYLIDFGGPNATTRGPAPDDAVNYRNNLYQNLGGTSSGVLARLVSSLNVTSFINLVMLSRFNGANENGTLNPLFLPPNATRDSLFGNTEAFSGLANVFPSFKLTGLDSAAKYNLTFYASRLSAGDNRETGYMVQGDNSGFTTLNPADNVTNSAMVVGITPTAAREITVSIAPTANNNNLYHFTYLGVLRVDAVLPPSELKPPVFADGRIVLDWTGNGNLEWSTSLSGPWTPITPPPTPPYSEEILPGQSRYFRLLANP